MKDYYKILGVDKSVSATEIKKTFRRKALLTHPDKSKTNTKDEFIELFEAYEILSNKKKRERYDKLYHLFFNETTDIKDEELKTDIKQILAKGQVYADDFRKFDKEILKEILWELFFGVDDLLFAATVTTFFGLWTILKGIMNLDFPYIFVGCVVTIVGLFFVKLKIDRVEKTSRQQNVSSMVR